MITRWAIEWKDLIALWAAVVVLMVTVVILEHRIDRLENQLQIVRSHVVTPSSVAPAPRPLPTTSDVRASRSRPLVWVTVKPTPRRYTPHHDWSKVAQCESSGNPRAVSSTGKYRGLYQFSLSSWAWVGGVGDPIDATPTEQTYRAERLLAKLGPGAWPHCGRYLR